MASTTESVTKPEPSGCQVSERSKGDLADRHAVGEEGEGRRAVPDLDDERRRIACLDAEIDVDAVEREGDLRVAVLARPPSRWDGGSGGAAAAAPTVVATIAPGGGCAQRRALGAEPVEGLEQDRRGADDAGEAGHRRAVRPADPDADDMAAVEADRPGVAIAVGGAGLVGDAAGRAVGRRRRAGEDVGDVPGGDRLEHRRAGLGGRRDGRSVAPSRSCTARAAAGDRGVERDEVAERDADAAEADGEARRRQVGQDRRRAGPLQPRHQPRRADRVEDDDRRDVERLRQRLADGDRAAMECRRNLPGHSRRSRWGGPRSGSRDGRGRPRRRGRR